MQRCVSSYLYSKKTESNFYVLYIKKKNTALDWLILFMNCHWMLLDIEHKTKIITCKCNMSQDERDRIILFAFVYYSHHLYNLQKEQIKAITSSQYLMLSLQKSNRAQCGYLKIRIHELSSSWIF